MVKVFKGCINYILDKQKETILLDTQGMRLKKQRVNYSQFCRTGKAESLLGYNRRAYFPEFLRTG